jgi:hypothetical protein
VSLSNVAQTWTDNVAPLASLSALRSRKNTLASIFSLPPEILVTIFTYFVEEENVKIITHRSGAPTPIIITHVCRHWCQDALEAASARVFGHISPFSLLLGYPPCLRGRKKLLWLSYTVHWPRHNISHWCKFSRSCLESKSSSCPHSQLMSIASWTACSRSPPRYFRHSNTGS